MDKSNRLQFTISNYVDIYGMVEDGKPLEEWIHEYDVSVLKKPIHHFGDDDSLEEVEYWKGKIDYSYCGFYASSMLENLEILCDIWFERGGN